MKTTKEMIEVMQAFEAGKEIEASKKWDVLNSCPLTERWVSAPSPIWDWSHCDYRIKSEKKEPQYRPYENLKEMIKDFDRRFPDNHPKYAMPLIWVEDMCYTKKLITEFDSIGVCIDGRYYNWIELSDRYTYLDGTPVGKLVE